RSSPASTKAEPPPGSVGHWVFRRRAWGRQRRAVKDCRRENGGAIRSWAKYKYKTALDRLAPPARYSLDIVGMGMNLPNALTILRIFFVPLLVAALVQETVGFQVGDVRVTNDWLSLAI